MRARAFGAARGEARATLMSSTPPRPLFSEWEGGRGTAEKNTTAIFVRGVANSSPPQPLPRPSFDRGRLFIAPLSASPSASFYLGARVLCSRASAHLSPMRPVFTALLCPRRCDIARPEILLDSQPYLSLAAIGVAAVSRAWREMKKKSVLLGVFFRPRRF